MRGDGERELSEKCSRLAACPQLHETPERGPLMRPARRPKGSPRFEGPGFRLQVGKAENPHGGRGGSPVGRRVRSGPGTTALPGSLRQPGGAGPGRTSSTGIRTKLLRGLSGKRSLALCGSHLPQGCRARRWSAFRGVERGGKMRGYQRHRVPRPRTPQSKRADLQTSAWGAGAGRLRGRVCG